MADALRDGVGSGLSLLFGRGLEKADALRRELLRLRPQSQVRGRAAANADVWGPCGPRVRLLRAYVFELVSGYSFGKEAAGIVSGDVSPNALSRCPPSVITL